MFPMSDLSSATKALAIAVVTAGFLAGLVHITGLWPAVRSPETASAAEIPNFGPDIITSWFPAREEGDDFYPPESGPGPVMSDPAHPYITNGEGRQPTYRVADLS